MKRTIQGDIVVHGPCWLAKITRGDKPYFFGNFESEDAAIDAYIALAWQQELVETNVPITEAQTQRMAAVLGELDIAYFQQLLITLENAEIYVPPPPKRPLPPRLVRLDPAKMPSA